MGKKRMDIKILQNLLGTLFDSELNLAFFLPHSDIRNPTWEELRSFATEAYARALSDVLDAMDGDTSHLEEVMSEEGRLIYRYSDRELLVERLEQMAKEPHPEGESED